MRSFLLYLQVGYLLLFCGLSFTSVFIESDPLALGGFIFAVIWLLGLIILRWQRMVGGITITVCSLLLLLSGLYGQITRVNFISENGGMENPDGMGSPMAFLLGWMVMTLLCFLPGIVFFSSNALALWRTSRVKKIA